MRFWIDGCYIWHMRDFARRNWFHGNILYNSFSHSSVYLFLRLFAWSGEDQLYTVHHGDCVHCSRFVLVCFDLVPVYFMRIHWIGNVVILVQPVMKCHFDDILITDCTESCYFDNFRCSQWWKFRQNDNISASVSFITHGHIGSCPNVEFAPYIVSDKHVTAMRKRYINRYKQTLWCFMKEQLIDASLNDVKHNYILSNDWMPST